MTAPSESFGQASPAPQASPSELAPAPQASPEVWWEFPLSIASQNMLMEYLSKKIVPQLDAKNKREFDNVMNSILTEDPRLRMFHFLRLKNVLRSSASLAGAAGAGEKRAGHRASEIVDYLKSAGLKTDRDLRVLDVGCGDGSITAEVAKMLGVSKENMVCTELDSVTPGKSESLTRVAVTQENPLPFENHSFDVVIASEVLHHVPDVTRMISEISRVTKKEGIVLVREHNLNLGKAYNMNIYDSAQYVDWIHVPYALAENAKRLENAKCLLPAQWDELFRSQGFRKAVVPRAKPTLALAFYSAYVKR